jgi:hypothetical protein
VTKPAIGKLFRNNGSIYLTKQAVNWLLLVVQKLTQNNTLVIFAKIPFSFGIGDFFLYLFAYNSF